jgi:hypothetical protein
MVLMDVLCIGRAALLIVQGFDGDELGWIALG